MAGTTFRINVREVEALADRLNSIDGRQLGLVARDVVNEVTVDFEKKAIDGGTANINLDRAYVRSKMDLALATSTTKPRAEIVTRGDLTVMGHFEPVRLRAPGAPRRAGPVKGNRSAGVLVNVTNDDRLFEPQWFLMRLKNQGGLMGVFVRDDSIKPSPTALREGKAGKRHVYGPSPYQLFRKQIDVRGPQLARDLEDTAVRRLIDDIERVLL